MVSIHPPTRGATLKVYSLPSMFKSFNPRAHAGRDTGEETTTEPLFLFQSTRPRGARPPYYTHPQKWFWFQSTRPRGARPKTYNDYMAEIKFQSTRPRGARPD